MKNLPMDETEAPSKPGSRAHIGDDSLDGMYQFPLDDSYVSNIHRIFDISAESSSREKTNRILGTKLMAGLYRLTS